MMRLTWHQKREREAFTNAYAYNLRELATYLEKYETVTKKSQLELIEEIAVLLVGNILKYKNIEWKQTILKQYVFTCTHNISGRTTLISIAELAQNLREKAAWMMKHIRRSEWVIDVYV